MSQSDAHGNIEMAVETILPIAISAAAWGLRIKYDYVGAIRDLRWVLGFVAWQRRQLIQTAVVVVYSAYFLLGTNSLSLCITTACSIFIFYMHRNMILLQRHQQLDQARRDRDNERGLRYLSPPISRLRPLLFPSRVFHMRKFPKTHSFSYSYLMAGIPVGWRGSVGALLSADMKSLPWQGRKPLAAWFSIESADHLARGDSVHGLQGKLEEYLCSIKEDPDQFDDAYLITAPTFLGYSFNPASFWYLYNQRKLEAMIVEVSNTFDEKRMYFLRDSEVVSGSLTTDGLVAKWEKDFHVSPFSSRKGFYDMSSLDPFHPPRMGKKFSNTIQLYSSKHALKILARVSSSSPARDPSIMSSWDTFLFLGAWWWVGFMTFPRIAVEAGKLFFRRRLSVWYRPEVQKESIGRHATIDECDIAALFNDFLRARVENSALPLPLSYTPSTNDTPKEQIFIPKSLKQNSNIKEEQITFTPTTPAFYAKIARSANLSDAVVPKPDPLKSFFYTSHPSLVFDLLRQSQTQPHRKAPNAYFFKLPDLVRTRWMLIKVLRNMSIKTFVLYDHQAYLSDLDWYAIGRASSPKSDAYRRATVKLLASDFLTAGVPEVIDAALWAVGVWLCWVHVSVLTEIVRGSGAAWSGNVSEMLVGALRLFGVHLWWSLGRLV